MRQRNGHIENYLRQAQNQINQRQLGASGERFMGVDGRVDGQAPFMKFTNDLDPGSFYGADGSNAGQAAMNNGATSQPYALQISNASAATISNFTIWQANTYLDQGSYSWSAGSLTVSGVTISSVYGGNITYWTMLQQSQQGPFGVGKTYMNVLSGSNGQVTQPLNLTTIDMNGDQASKIIPNLVSPNQFQAGILENSSTYRIDGYTGVAITVLPSAVFQIYFFPSATVNLARGIVGAPIGRVYSDRSIGAPTPVQLVN